MHPTTALTALEPADRGAHSRRRCAAFYLGCRKLGQGGFGSVFVARDTSLDREVALKFMHAEHTANAEIVRRFLQEARSAGEARVHNRRCALAGDVDLLERREAARPAPNGQQDETVVSVSGRVRVDSFRIARAIAVRGVGVLRTASVFGERFVKSGDLVPVLERLWWRTPLYAAGPKSVHFSRSFAPPRTPRCRKMAARAGCRREATSQRPG